MSLGAQGSDQLLHVDGLAVATGDAVMEQNFERRLPGRLCQCRLKRHLPSDPLLQRVDGVHAKS
jgi:hypothetical protein